MTQYREHRGSSADSMATARVVADRAELEMMLAEDFRPWVGARDDIDWSSLKIERYCFDDRIGWDTYIVTVSGYGVLGMIDGPL